MSEVTDFCFDIYALITLEIEHMPDRSNPNSGAVLTALDQQAARLAELEIVINRMKAALEGYERRLASNPPEEVANILRGKRRDMYYALHGTLEGLEPGQ